MGELEHVHDAVGAHVPVVEQGPEVYVAYLRRKLNAADEPDLIHAVRGVGYVLREHRRTS